MMAATTISSEDFARFADYFYQRTGILFDDSKRYFVDRRLADRIKATDSVDVPAYLRLLRLDISGREAQTLTNLMTVNETYFFREAYQFSCLTDHLLGEIIRNKRSAEPIRIWSMPCSTGEEAYSIVIHLMERWGAIDSYDVEILASDIDTQVLDQARKGVYSPRSVQSISADLLARYFSRHGHGAWQVSADLRDSVEFFRANVIDRPDMSRFAKMDVIFCRNLLIYFDDMSRRAAAEAFYEAMNPGGFICLGHSESMSRISSLFKARRFGSTIVYQKPLLGEAL
jgi:chemotaxis protein methyltransferase CheR